MNALTFQKWGVLLLLGSVGLPACVPQAFQEADFRKHLTPAERVTLAAGQTVNKQHQSYWVLHPKQLYWEGPLRVQPLPGGKLKFQTLGHWMQYDERGGLLCESTYTASSVGNTGTSRVYYPAGTLQAVVRAWPARVGNDSVMLTRIANFRQGNEQDTAYVEQWYSQGGHYRRPGQRSFDWQGRRPVPAGWHYRP